jgi:hypothetical protein
MVYFNHAVALGATPLFVAFGAFHRRASAADIEFGRIVTLAVNHATRYYTS